MPHERRGRWAAVVLVVAVVTASAGCRSRHPAQEHFDRGAAAFQKGDYDAAIAAYEKGLEVEPRSAVGHNLLGMAYRFKFNTVRDSRYKDKEIAAFRAALDADSTYVPALINLGATLYYLGRKSEAAPLLQRALILQPENPERAELERFIREGGVEPPAR